MARGFRFEGPRHRVEGSEVGPVPPGSELRKAEEPSAANALCGRRATTILKRLPIEEELRIPETSLNRRAGSWNGEQGRFRLFLLQGN